MSPKGFTAVEVMVTLIIAVLLIGGAYQAYNVVINNTAEARERAIVSNHVYERLQREASRATRPCSARFLFSAPPTDMPITSPSGVTIRTTCPYGTTSDLSLVTATMSYGPSPKKEVKHAILTR